MNPAEFSVSQGLIVRETMSVELADTMLYRYYGAPSPDGVTEKSLEITLPRNAVVRTFELVMTAAPAHAVRAGDAGQVRTSPVPGGQSVVIEFGTPRTVSAVQAPDGVLITSVSTWIGTEFDARPKFVSDGARFVRLPSEVRTEKLQLFVSGNPSTETLATETVLVVPESPAGLELRIDGAAPAFAQVAAVEPGNATTLSSQLWSSEHKRIVDLAPALAPLTRNALDDSQATFRVTLTSRVPGTLDLQLRPGGQEVAYIRRALFNGQPLREVSFEAEGEQEVALESLPSDLEVEEVRMTVVGAPPAGRVVPALGPEPPEPPFAELTLTPDRAALVRVQLEPRLAEITAVRVPLRAGEAGAEARVLLWRSVDLVDLSPLEPLPTGASDPISVPAGSEVWRTFALPKPLPAPKDHVLWAAVTVNRGSASTTLADVASGPGAERVLWGAPSGPWHDLPASLSSVRGRMRVGGKSKPDVVLPPLRVELGSLSAEVTPNAKGTPVVLRGSAASAQQGTATLRLVSHAEWSGSLREIDVVSRT